MMAMVGAWRTIPTHEACRHESGLGAQCIVGKPGIMIACSCCVLVHAHVHVPMIQNRTGPNSPEQVLSMMGITLACQAPTAVIQELINRTVFARYSRGSKLGDRHDVYFWVSTDEP